MSTEALSEAEQDPSVSVLRWIQTRVFTSEEAYYDEECGQRLIDQTSGKDCFLWIGLEGEGGHKLVVEDEEGAEVELPKMAHVTLESHEGLHRFETRWMSVFLRSEGPRVHMHRHLRDYSTDLEESEYRWLDDVETAELFQELDN